MDPILALNVSKARAEKAVLDLSTLRDVNVSSAEWAYEDARAKWNGWLNTLVFAASTGQSVDEWPAHRRAAEEASEATNVFLARAQEFLGSNSTLVTDPTDENQQPDNATNPTVGSAPTVGVDPITASATLVTIGLQLWQGWQVVDQEQRLLYVDQLQRLKWQPFDAIATNRTLSSTQWLTPHDPARFLL